MMDFIIRILVQYVQNLSYLSLTAPDRHCRNKKNLVNNISSEVSICTYYAPKVTAEHSCCISAPLLTRTSSVPPVIFPTVSAAF